MKLYAVVSFWCDELFGGGELSINSPFYTSREEAEKHMYARESPDDYIKEYEMSDKFEGLSDIEIEIKERRNKNRK